MSDRRIRIPTFRIVIPPLSDEEAAQRTRPLAICRRCKYILCSCGRCQSIECKASCRYEDESDEEAAR
jgi:hypothetical protein